MSMTTEDRVTNLLDALGITDWNIEAVRKVESALREAERAAKEQLLGVIETISTKCLEGKVDLMFIAALCGGVLKLEYAEYAISTTKTEDDE